MPGPGRLSELTQRANDLARGRTPDEMREAIKANAELGQVLQTLDASAVPRRLEQVARHLGLALSRALVLRDDAPAHPRALLDAVGPLQPLIELDGVIVPRGDIENIANGRWPIADANFLQNREALWRVEARHQTGVGTQCLFGRTVVQRGMGVGCA